MFGRLREKRRKIRPYLELSDFEWIKGVPYNIRDNSICDIDKAYQNFFWGATYQPSTEFRSKKATQESIVIQSRDWMMDSKSFGFLKNMFAYEDFSTLNGFDSRLIGTRLGLCERVHHL
jgi:hypothetical protein